MGKSYLNIAIDLGTESVKIVGAYKPKKGAVKKHFFTEDEDFHHVPFSSLALYLGAPQNKWVFGQEINKKEDYANIVRVKEMLYLLSSSVKEDKDYYENEKHFPIFIFPQKPDQPNIKDGMESLVDEGYTFVANTTPREMTREFFKAMFDSCINKQAQKILKDNPHLEGIKYISVYPDPKTIKKEYVKELENLIAYGAGLPEGSPLISSISAPQAVAIGAYTEQMIKATDYSNDNEKTLIFDIGEKDISIAKVDVKRLNDKGEFSICVEGTDGHEQALAVGGADIDSVIGEYVHEKIKKEGAEKEGNSVTQDYMSYRQQYRLLRFVKSAKKHLLHFDYAYVTVEKDVNYDIRLSKNEFESIVFLKDNSVGSKIIDYIITELKRQGNENVKTVLLVGGGAASYHLRDYAEEKCNEIGLSGIEFTAIDNTKNDISEYFSAIGAAMREPSDIQLKVVSAYAYGSWRYQAATSGKQFWSSRGENVIPDDKVFNVWLNRGDELTGEAATIECTDATSFKDYMYKLNKRVDDTREEDEVYEFHYVNPFVIGCRIGHVSEFSYSDIMEHQEINDRRYEKAKKQGLKLIGNQEADYIDVKFAVKNTRTGRIEYLSDFSDTFGGNPFYFKQGIRLDNDGNVTMFYENAVEENREHNPNKTVRDSSGNVHKYEEIIIEHDFGVFKIETN